MQAAPQLVHVMNQFSDVRCPQVAESLTLALVGRTPVLEQLGAGPKRAQARIPSSPIERSQSPVARVGQCARPVHDCFDLAPLRRPDDCKGDDGVARQTGDSVIASWQTTRLPMSAVARPLSLIRCKPGTFSI